MFSPVIYLCERYFNWAQGSQAGIQLKEPKTKKEGNDSEKEGAANVNTCALLLNNSARVPVVNHV